MNKFLINNNAWGIVNFLFNHVIYQTEKIFNSTVLFFKQNLLETLGYYNKLVGIKIMLFTLAIKYLILINNI